MSPTDTRARRAQAAVTCPVCGAAPGVPCRFSEAEAQARAAQDARVHVVHHARRQAWVRAKRENTMEPPDDSH